jgi:hypothetical protein
MATDIVQSLFGITPDSYRQQQSAMADAQALQFARLSPQEKASFGIQRGAYGLAGAIGGALGGQDPGLQRITMRQQIAGQIDYNDEASMKRGIAALSQAGDSQGAMQLQQIFLNQEKTRAETTKLMRERAAADPFEQLVRTGKYTPASLATYRQSGDVSQLELLEKTKDDVVVVGNALVSKSTGQPIYEGSKPEKFSAFAQELIDAGFTPGTEPFQKRMLEYVTKKTEGAGKGTGNFSIGGITIDSGAAAKKAGEIIGTNVANVEQQFSLQTAFKDAITILGDGIYGGAYGPEKQFLAKFVGVGDPKKVQNTEVFLANIGEIVIPRLVQFGGNDSNEELKYLQKVVAGDQRLEPEAVKRILVSAEKKVQKNLARLQAQTAAGATGAALPIGPVTPAPAPAPTKRYNPQTRKIESISGD